MTPFPPAAVELVVPGPECEAEFLTLVAQSADLHMGWVQPPSDPDAYALPPTDLPAQPQGIHRPRKIASGRVVGVVNLNDIVLGALRSASLGYYGFESSTGGGRMTEAVRLSIDHGFGELGLHRLEANIQPGNGPSRALVQRLGFRLEGFSPRYLYVAGAWRDHERWAVLSEDWRSSASHRSV